jgi:geranylgeranyl pyrophosphate synthase
MKGQPYNLCTPADRQALQALREAVEHYGSTQRLTAPLSREELDFHATRLLDGQSLPPALSDFARVLLGNAAWRDAVAATPYDRRILLLPQCLRSSTDCQGEFDALGLLCAECGKCAIGTIQQEAERLGYAVLVAEGTTAVTTLLTRGDADAIIGVGCLHALEQSFEALTANAIPSLAIPLLRNECTDTVTELDWLFELLALRDETLRPIRMDVPGLRRDVDRWFEPDALRELLCRTGSETERIATDWLGKAGKRWRPLLAAGVYRTMAPEPSLETETQRRLAVAAECFHKASLIHDDIEDEDDTRYGEQTLHCQYGVAIALNIGDLLIGEGYRLISESGLPPDLAATMIRTAAEGHRTLCLGQGEELLLAATFKGKTTDPTPNVQPPTSNVQRPTPNDQSPITDAPSPAPSVEKVINIFRQKTAPAFDVALQLGAIAAGASQQTRAILAAFSDAIGIAYQIKDDIDDHASDELEPNGRGHGGSWLLAALAHEGQPSHRVILERARALQHHYAEETRRCLVPLTHAPLKCLLFRIAHLFLDPTL